MKVQGPVGTLGRALVIVPVYGWMALFFLTPFLFVFAISFSEAIIASPPIAPLTRHDPAGGTFEIRLRLFNYQLLWEDNLYLRAYLNAIWVALKSTLATLLIGYPIALAIARSTKRMQGVLILAIMLPFWTSLLVRVYAWIGILRQDGVLNMVLLWTGLIDQPLVLLQTEMATYIGIVYTYLPFMVLPIYAVLEAQDHDTRDAARDLGATPLVTFLTITLPLSLGGVVAGCLLVFIPSVGQFVIPSLLSGDSSLMIGRVLWNEFFSNRDWPVASAVAIIMLAVLVIPIMAFQRALNREI
ncbi:ABC transporter permease subunit [Yoonia sp.]|uniref:ABC transporter permease subunit n=1 Tax=Yoonia sp. TaxID=2212373 RepID=UPI003FCDD9A6